MFYPIIYIRSPHSLLDQQYSVFTTDDDKDNWSIRESVRPVKDVFVFSKEQKTVIDNLINQVECFIEQANLGNVREGDYNKLNKAFGLYIQSQK